MYLLTACLLLQACNSSDNKNSSPAGAPGGPAPEPVVEAYIAGTGSIEDQLELPGTLVAEDATEIHPESSGRLTYLNIREGAFIRKGTLLGKIYNDDLKAQLKKLQIQLETAEKTQNRYESLLSIQGVSRQEYDLKVLEVNNLKYESEMLQASLRKTEIRAPFDGILGLKMVSEGAFVTPTSSLTTIRKKGGTKVEFTVPERYLDKCKAGDEILFKPEGGNQNYRARLYASQTSVTESSRSLTWRAEVTDDGASLVPGTFVKVRTQFAKDSLTVTLPSRAIIPQARGKRVVLAKGGKTLFSNVETGRRDSANVEILTGVNPGDTVVLTGLMGMKPDTKIKISKIRN